MAIGSALIMGGVLLVETGAAHGATRFLDDGGALGLQPRTAPDGSVLGLLAAGFPPLRIVGQQPFQPLRDEHVVVGHVAQAFALHR